MFSSCETRSLPVCRLRLQVLWQKPGKVKLPMRTNHNHSSNRAATSKAGPNLLRLFLRSFSASALGVLQ